MGRGRNLGLLDNYVYLGRNRCQAVTGIVHPAYILRQGGDKHLTFARASLAIQAFVKEALK